MSDKRGIIKNIKPVFCRFDMDDEPERRAWQIIQKLSKGNGEGKNRSYNSIISEAVVGYYDEVTMSHEEQAAPKTEELNEAALDFMDGFMGM